MREGETERMKDGGTEGKRVGVRSRSVIRKHTDLDVYKLSFDTAMSLFEISKSFPREEVFSLTDQMRRSSRSVSGNITEAWRKRRYPAAFMSKLSDAEGEAAETQTWIQYAVACHYLTPEQARPLYAAYDSILGMLVTMIKNPEHWKF